MRQGEKEWKENKTKRNGSQRRECGRDKCNKQVVMRNTTGDKRDSD